MCAIIDADVVSKVFCLNRKPAADQFFNWVNAGQGRLVIGGTLEIELYKNGTFRSWAESALKAGRLRFENKKSVMDKSKELKASYRLRSDDPHTIALAMVSGARLLYSNDKDLHKDFKNEKLINDPQGRIFSTNNSENFTRQKRQLLAKKNLCRPKR